MSTDFSNIFDMDTEKLVTKEEIKESDVYKPSLDREKKTSYKSIIKFLPWYKDWTKSKITKWVVFLQNPDTKDFKTIDCPSTVKEKSILQDIFFALRNSELAEYKELSPLFSRKQVAFSLVQIVKDEQHPELEGKIKIFSYGKTILDKIEAELNPSDEDIDKNNPFDIFDGKLFSLSIKKVGGFPNYDESKFIDKKRGLVIGGEEMKKDKKNMEKIVKHLTENSPELTKYEYTPWDEETKRFVVETIKAIVPDGNLFESVMSRNKDFLNYTPASMNVNKPKKKVHTEEIDDSLSDVDEYMSSKSKGKDRKRADIDAFDEDDEHGVDGINHAEEEDDIDGLLNDINKRSKKSVDDLDFFED